MGTLLRAKRSWAEWKLRNSHPLNLPSPPFHSHIPKQGRSSTINLIRWQLPAGGAVKLNCDGAKSSRGASAGFVLRSWMGSFIMAGTRYLAHAPILVAEVTAIRDGLKAALEAGYRHIEVEGDNQIVINAIQGRILPPWRIAPIIEDIKNLSQGCFDISFKHIYREGNMAADWVAKYGCTLQSFSVTFFLYPPSREFIFILADDNLGRSLERGTT